MFSITTLLVFLTTLLFFYNWRKHSYWKSKSVPTPPFWPIIGHFVDLFVGYRWDNLDKIYKKMKSRGCWGIYVGLTPELVICDPSRLREVMVKDADHFTDKRTMNYSGNDAIFSEMLTVVGGEKWKNLRSVLSPTFTSGKIKSMFHLISSKAQDLVNECERMMKEKHSLEMTALCRYYTMDVIATCAFGIDVHCIKNKESSQFIKSGQQLMSVDFKKILKFLILAISPRLYKILGLQIVNEHMDFFVNVVEETVQIRLKEKIKRGDFLDILLEALEESKSGRTDSKYPMTVNTIIAESILFLLAGFDNTSNTIAFCIYLLAKNKDKQDLLRKELQKIIQTEGELTYQNIMEANYLDACLSESLRLYSPAHYTERKCTKSYKFEETDIEIPYGMMVGVPIWSIHHDPDHWKDPFKFLPERFLPENKGKVTPYTFMPFGLGPRNCIAMRFAQLEAKLVIAKLILSNDIDLKPGFTEMKLLKSLGTLRPDENGIQLTLNELTQ